MSRPSETLQGIVSSVLGGVVLILEGAGVNVNPKIIAGATILLGWVALVWTLRVAKQQRAGTKTSAADGKVA